MFYWCVLFKSNLTCLFLLLGLSIAAIAIAEERASKGVATEAEATIGEASIGVEAVIELVRESITVLIKTVWHTIPVLIITEVAGVAVDAASHGNSQSKGEEHKEGTDHLVVFSLGVIPM